MIQSPMAMAANVTQTVLLAGSLPLAKACFFFLTSCDYTENTRVALRLAISQ